MGVQDVERQAQSIDTKKLLELLEDSLAIAAEQRQDWVAALDVTPRERGELQRLLDSRTKAAGAFETRHLGAVAALNAITEGMQVGAYRLVSLIGAGGMGKVFLAERNDGAYEQLVAIKFTSSSLPGSVLTEQFQRERQILARLTHPNIAILHDAGAFNDTPYVVMEYVLGLTIDEHVREHCESIAEILELVIQVCNGVQHAHTALVVHRDIKPTNILVTLEGDAKVLDFGIAAELTQDQEMSKAYTEAYASPEQRAGGLQSTTSDVYSIGKVCSELLQQRKVTKDLGAILDRACHKNPEQRYESAGAMAADLKRYLGHQTVAAVPPSFGYSFTKFVRRSPLLVGVSVFAIVSLITGVIGFAYQAQQAELGKQFAESQTQRAEAVTNFFRQLMYAANPGSTAGPDATVRDVMQRASSRLLSADVEDVSARDLGAIHLGAALAFDGLGDADAASAHIDAAIAINEELVAQGDTLAPSYLAEAFSYKAGSFGVDGDLSGAIEFAQRAEDIYAKGHGGVAERAANLASLGLSVFRQGDADAAEVLLLQATGLELDEALSEHMEIKAGVLNFLSNLYANTGREAQATAVSQQSIEILSRVNPNNLGLLIAMANLATSFNKQARYEEAEAQYADLDDRMRRVMTPGDPSRLIIQANRASNLRAYRGAAESLDQAQKAYDEIMLHTPENARIRGLGEHVLGEHLCHLGRSAQGVKLARAAIASRTESTNAKDFYTHQSRLVLAECLASQDEWDEARALARQVHADYAETLGKDHPATLRAGKLIE